MSDIQKKFGERLRTLRTLQKLSREQLAELSGLHWTYIGSVERGERNISIKNIKKLADALDIKLKDLFAGIDENKKN